MMNDTTTFLLDDETSMSDWLLVKDDHLEFHINDLVAEDIRLVNENDSIVPPFFTFSSSSFLSFSDQTQKNERNKAEDAAQHGADKTASSRPLRGNRSIVSRRTTKRVLQTHYPSSSSAKINKKTTKCTKSKRKKMAVGRPKRPMTGYNLFFQLFRNRLVEGNDSLHFTQQEIDQICYTPKGDDCKKKRLHRRTHGKIGFKELAFTIGAKWKTLDLRYKEMFIRRASLDRARFDREMEAWKTKQRGGAVSNQGKRALSSNPVATTGDVVKDSQTLVSSQASSLPLGTENQSLFAVLSKVFDFSGDVGDDQHNDGDFEMIPEPIDIDLPVCASRNNSSEQKEFFFGGMVSPVMEQSFQQRLSTECVHADVSNAILASPPLMMNQAGSLWNNSVLASSYPAQPATMMTSSIFSPTTTVVLPQGARPSPQLLPATAFF